jgi:D-3-phosphoglycerate dehydrogenase
VQLLELDELLGTADFITIHMPKTPETTGMISTEQFAKMKPTAFVFNVARGGLIDEAALATALTEHTIAGAGIDVYTTEPPHELPFIGLENVNVTPHLGASTAEAQEKAGVAVAKSVRLALSGELVPDAVNVAGGVIDEDVRPGIPLAEKLGRIFSALGQGERLESVELNVAGEIAVKDVTSLKLAALKGVFKDVVSDQVSYVNAPVLAEQRGVETRLTTTEESEDYRNQLTVAGALTSGEQISVAGTLTGPKQIQKLVGVMGYAVEIELSEHLLVIRYTDRPGVVGTLGQALGAADVNIAGMQVSRSSQGGEAVAVITIDSALPEGVLDAVAEAVGVSAAREVNLED